MQGQEEAVHDDSMGHGEQEGKGRQQNNLLHIFTLDWCACINGGYGDRGLNHTQDVLTVWRYPQESLS